MLHPKSIFIFCISLIHVVFVSLLLYPSSLFSPKKQHKPLMVKTRIAPSFPSAEKKASQPISQTPSQPKKIPSTQNPPKPSATAIKKPIAKPVATEKKPTTPKETRPKPSPKEQKPILKQAKQPSAMPISASLLQELEESIAKIEDKSDKNRWDKTTRLKAPASVLPALQIDAQDIDNAAEQNNYIAILIEYLHASLHLPDFGEVKIELTLQQDGTVVKLIVLKTESEENKKYLESRLPQLKFPHLKGSYAKKNEQTIILNFCNEL